MPASSPARVDTVLLRVLLVEPNDHVRAYQAKGLAEEADVEFVAAVATAREAREQLALALPEVIVVDTVLADELREELLAAASARIVVTTLAASQSDHWVNAGVEAVADKALPARRLGAVVRRTMLRARPVVRRLDALQPAAEFAPAPAEGVSVRTILAAEAAERRRLGARLHDGPMQLVLIAAQEIEAAEDGDPDALGYAHQMIREAAAELRALLTEQDSGRLIGEIGLEAALGAIVGRHTQAAGIASTLCVEATVPDHLTGLVVDVVSEAVVNVIKHAGASQVDIALTEVGGTIVVRVADDGVGLDPEAALQLRPGHLGLPALADRLARLGGGLELSRAEAGGALLTAHLRP